MAHQTSFVVALACQVLDEGRSYWVHAVDLIVVGPTGGWPGSNGVAHADAVGLARRHALVTLSRAVVRQGDRRLLEVLVYPKSDWEATPRTHSQNSHRHRHHHHGHGSLGVCHDEPRYLSRDKGETTTGSFGSECDRKKHITQTLRWGLAINRNCSSMCCLAK